MTHKKKLVTFESLTENQQAAVHRYIQRVRTKGLIVELTDDKNHIVCYLNADRKKIIATTYLDQFQHYSP